MQYDKKFVCVIKNEIELVVYFHEGRLKYHEIR